MIRYSLPILEQSPAKIIDRIGESKEQYDLFEVWFDYVDGLGRAFAEQLAAELGSRLIGLFRRKELETMRTPRALRHEVALAIGAKGAFVDLDLASQQSEIAEIRRTASEIKTILSYHNYSSTPPLSELREIVSRMALNGATITKIATFCQTERDALRLLELSLELGEQNRRRIILGMGDHGRITRIFGTLWGNEMVFAPQSAECASAPGQLTRAELESIFQILGA